MKKIIKLFIFCLALILVFFTYKTFTKGDSKKYYIAIGDSIAEGMNSYGSIEYGYTDYINDYLEKNNRLKFYTKKFSKSGYTTQDVKNDINSNKVININNQSIYITEALRESDLVTISIGANDFIKGISIYEIDSIIQDTKSIKKKIDTIGTNVKEVIELIKKYAKNQIILVGYYNPFPRMKEYKEQIDEIVKYANHMYEQLAEDEKIEYIDIFDIFDNNTTDLPNPMNIHPIESGYKKIADKIINKIQ